MRSCDWQPMAVSCGPSDWEEAVLQGQRSRKDVQVKQQMNVHDMRPRLWCNDTLSRRGHCWSEVVGRGGQTLPGFRL